LLCIAIASLYAAFAQLERVESFDTRVHNVENVTGRLATYQVGMELFRTSPFFGVGVNRYVIEQARIQSVAVAGTAAVVTPHSSYLSILGEQGIFGLLPLLLVTAAAFWLIRALARRARDRPTRRLAVMAGAAGLGYLLMSLTLTMIPYVESNSLFMVLLGAVAGRLDAISDARDASLSEPGLGATL
jgi:O-antigen ligase